MNALRTASGAPVRRGTCLLALFVLLECVSLGQQVPTAPRVGNDVWQVPHSGNLMPHFEPVNGRQLLCVDGSPFTVLAVEIPWWDLIYGKYKETETAYDHLYPAAEKIGLNALKVPVKWSMIEPEKGVYDFSYVDHARAMADKYHLKLVLNWFGHNASGDGTIYANLTGNLYAPMYIVKDEETYPRAVDGNDVVHHNVASYWIRRITDAGAEVYPIPFFHNYVGGQLADWMVGGARGEDVQTYLTNCPHISFIGVN